MIKHRQEHLLVTVSVGSYRYEKHTALFIRRCARSLRVHDGESSNTLCDCQPHFGGASHNPICSLWAFMGNIAGKQVAIRVSCLDRGDNKFIPPNQEEKH